MNLQRECLLKDANIRKILNTLQSPYLVGVSV